MSEQAGATRRLRIWIDISNTPHVLFFEPIIRALEQRGHHLALTSRRFANTQELLAARGLRTHAIGAGYDAGRSEWRKRVQHYARAAQLIAWARGRFDVAVSHTSFTQAEAAHRLGIPIFIASDYEQRNLRIFRHADRLMIPSIVAPAAYERWGVPARAIRPYGGLKEHVYLAGFAPAGDLRAQLGIGERELLVTVRPIAHHAMYTDDSGDGLQERLLEAFAATEGVRVLIVPRTEVQRRALEPLARRWPALRLLRANVHGPSLLWASDLVVCGGGTMLREAAALGVPAVTIFPGALGAVDQWLLAQGRVTVVRGEDDLHRIRLERRPPGPPPSIGDTALRQIVDGICETAAGR